MIKFVILIFIATSNLSPAYASLSCFDVTSKRNLPIEGDQAWSDFMGSLISRESSETEKRFAEAISLSIEHYQQNRFLKANSTIFNFLDLDGTIIYEPTIHWTFTESNLAKHMQIGYWIGHDLDTIWSTPAMVLDQMGQNPSPFYFSTLSNSLHFPVISFDDSEFPLKIGTHEDALARFLPNADFKPANGRSLNEADQREWLILKSYYEGVLEESWHWMQHNIDGFSTPILPSVVDWVKETYPDYSSTLQLAVEKINTNQSIDTELTSEFLWERIVAEADIAALQLYVGRLFSGHASLTRASRELSTLFERFLRNAGKKNAHSSAILQLAHGLVFAYLQEKSDLDFYEILSGNPLDLDYTDNKSGSKTPPLSSNFESP